MNRKGAIVMTSNEKSTDFLYGLNEWEIVEKSFRPDKNDHHETVFAIGNGFIGMRGSYEEGLDKRGYKGFEGTFLNGIYENGVIRYGEIGYGYPERSQTMINVANSKSIKLFLDGETFDMLSGELLEYRRTLNMKEGFLRRNVIWRSPKGKEIKLEIERIACFSRKSIAAIRYCLIPLNFEGKVKLISELDGNVGNSASENDPRVGSGLENDVLETVITAAEEEFSALVQVTKRSRLAVACLSKEQEEEGYCPQIVRGTGNSHVETVYDFVAEKGKPFSLIKYIAYHAGCFPQETALGEAAEQLENAERAGYAVLKEENRLFLEAFWQKADIEINGDLPLQQAVRFNLFHLLQSVGRDGKTNICAKGLTGEGYEGHYFWDTEMYVVPAFLYSCPDISRKLLEYRYHTLDKARERARQMAHSKGALFPWRTIDGEECSGYYPASTAQYHINADITYAIKNYVEATNDLGFLKAYGAEIVFETARLWRDLGFFSEEKDGQFCIHCVTGPDEYTAIINNNCYTNLMARENLRYAWETAQWLEREENRCYGELKARLGLEAGEITEWKEAADRMYIPYSQKHGIHPQDDCFLEKKVWDFEATPPEHYPLLLHYHPLVIYRHQVCKQADVVLALFVLGHLFDKETKKRNFDYYEKVTTHDSSLSACIFSIVANDIGYCDKAYDYFIKTARMDLEDYHGNTNHGIHTANMAGSWMCIVNGFAGMRALNGKLSFAPSLPKAWEKLSFKLSYRGCRVKVAISRRNAVYELLEGECMTLLHRGEEIQLSKDQPVTVEW